MELQSTTHERSRRARRLGLVAIGIVAVALLVPSGAFADGNVQVTPPGGLGMITSDPPGINCPPACGPINFPDAKVMLTAVGLNGYSFSRWDGCASEDASTTPTRCEVDTTPDATTTITASFDPAAKLDVSPQGPGSVQATFDTATGEGVTSSDFSSGPGECHDFADSDGSAHCILPYLRGRVVTLTASPNTGEPFLGWGRYDCPATSLTCVITMNSAHESVAPLFGATGTLHVLLGGVGVVTSSPGGLADNSTGEPQPCASASTQDNAGPTCDLTAPMLSQVRLTVTGNSGAPIVWSPRCDVPIGDPATCIVTMGGRSGSRSRSEMCNLRRHRRRATTSSSLSLTPVAARFAARVSIAARPARRSTRSAFTRPWSRTRTPASTSSPGVAHAPRRRRAACGSDRRRRWSPSSTLIRQRRGESPSQAESKSKGQDGTQRSGKVQLRRTDHAVPPGRPSARSGSGRTPLRERGRGPAREPPARPGTSDVVGQAPTRPADSADTRPARRRRRPRTTGAQTDRCVWKPADAEALASAPPMTWQPDLTTRARAC